MRYKYPVSRPCIGQHETIRVRAALALCQLSAGPNVKAFEEAFGALLGREAIACSSGTTALHLAMVAMNVTPGCEVLVPDLTYVATANAVKYVGATPVFVDVDRKTGCMDPKKASAAITPRTVGMIPVHLYGVPCDMHPLMILAREQGLFVVEDAAEGFGGNFPDGKPMGTAGDMATFSFYGNKIMTTGEGGMVVTDNPVVAIRVRHLLGMAHSAQRRYYHDELGFNYRMTDLQGAMGLGQLDHLHDMVDRRLEICERYSKALTGFSWPDGHAPWLYTFLLPDDCMRDRFIDRMASKGIETRPTFVPMHQMPMFPGHNVDFPNACFWSEQGVSLPTFPELENDDVDYICNEVWNAI